MKGKSITFRPKKEMRERLDALAASTERPVTFYIEKAIEAALPELEKRYAGEANQPLIRVPGKYPPHREHDVTMHESAPDTAAKKDIESEARIVAAEKKIARALKKTSGETPHPK